MSMQERVFAISAAITLLTVAAPVTLPAQTGADSRNSQQTDEASESSQDRDTAQRVSQALKADRSSYYNHVTVTARSGVVTLGGFVGSDTSLAKAKQIASGVPGVSKVVDQIELQPSGNQGPGSAH